MIDNSIMKIPMSISAPKMHPSPHKAHLGPRIVTRVACRAHTQRQAARNASPFSTRNPTLHTIRTPRWHRHIGHHTYIQTNASSESADAPTSPSSSSSSFSSSKVALALVTLLAVVVFVAFNHFHVPLSRSGFFASLSLIFASEIGDKTFFIAALLAMRYGKLLSFLGSVSSLSLMTAISVVIGYAVQRVPSVVESSEIFGKYLSAASLLYFGLKSLYLAAKSGDATAGDELVEAEEQVGKAEKDGSIQKNDSSRRAGADVQTRFQSFMEIAGLIFVAEWGDRSMLATIALGAAQSPLGVAGGAILGHAVATCIAVVGGAALADRISEKTVNVIGGVLFILFAGATALGVF